MSHLIVIFITIFSGFLVVYHHLGYPLILRLFHRNKFQNKRSVNERKFVASELDENLPSVTIVIPAYNEEKWISEKIKNLASLDYPSSKLNVIIGCDGCTDNTYEIAKQTLTETECKNLSVNIKNHPINRGKVAVLNEIIGSVDTDLVALTDVSALISIDALLISAKHFEDPTIGVLNSHYHLLNPGSEGEATYWKYQSAIKEKEASLGSTLGAHGALYLFRRKLFQPLAPDTINDDFMLPMSIVADGYRAEYSSEVNAIELEKVDKTKELQRRKRIAAGNLQQLLRLKSLMLPSRRGVAFTFISGKALRVLMPYLMTIALIGCLWLSSQYILFMVLAIIQVIAYSIAAWGIMFPLKNSNRIVKALSYLVSGHISGMIGTFRYACSLDIGGWGSNNIEQSNKESQTNSAILSTEPCDINSTTDKIKRIFDIFLASSGLLLTLPFFPLIGLLIKLNSPGPIFFKQIRIGRALPNRTTLFEMIKFRTMVEDAECETGATWATSKDPRITVVGRFLRKTRIDEIPQFFNVLAGDMSVVGPRPERPEFYRKLESAIPFFSDRTYGVSPGITGLAQINQGYDTSIEDVRKKVGFDHRYALALIDPISWIKMDISILIKTVGVVILGRGL